MKLFDVLLGRTKPAEADLDALFGLPGAVITLQASENLLPTNQGGVCYKPMAGQRFEKTTEEMSELLGLDSGPGETGGRVRQETDQYGYEWIVVESNDFQEFVNQVHVVNTTLEEQSYGPSLLCSVFGFSAGPHLGPEDTPVAGAKPSGSASTYLVYLYKRGTFYPFMPLPGREKRDVPSELRLAEVLKEDLKIEPQKERWMPLWGLPVH